MSEKNIYKKGDFCSKNGSIFIFNSYEKNRAYSAICGIGFDGRFKAGPVEWGAILEYDEPIRPASEGEKLLLLEAIYKNGYEWDFNNIVLKTIDMSDEYSCGKTPKMKYTIDIAKKFTDDEWSELWSEFNRQTKTNRINMRKLTEISELKKDIFEELHVCPWWKRLFKRHRKYYFIVKEESGGVGVGHSATCPNCGKTYDITDYSKVIGKK